jgi:hypothetical protein
MGRAAAASGKLLSAEGYYLESLDTSYDLGQTREMLATMLELARVRADEGDTRSAAEILGTILGDPAGSQLVPPDPESIHASAERAWTDLLSQGDDGELEAARGRGSQRTVEIAAAELLSNAWEPIGRSRAL